MVVFYFWNYAKLIKKLEIWYKGLFFFEPFQNKLLTCRPNNRMLYCMEDRIPHSYNVMMRMRKSTLLYSYFYHLILKPYTSIWIGVHEYQLHCLLPLVVFLLGSPVHSVLSALSVFARFSWLCYFEDGMPAALKNGAHSDFISHGAALGGMSPKGHGALLYVVPWWQISVVTFLIRLILITCFQWYPPAFPTQ